MKLLYLITDLETGGVPLHLYRLARSMRDGGHDVSVTCLSPPGPVSAMLEEAGIPTGACGARGAWDLRILPRLRGRIIQTQPDVVHAFLFHANVAARLLAGLGTFPRQRLICEIQTVEVERTWHLTVERYTHPWCRYVVGNSPSVVAHLARRAGVPPHRLVLVQGGIDAEPIRRARPIDRASLGLLAGAPVVLWTGRLDPVKRVDDLVLAAAQLVRQAIPLQLLIVGEGPEQPRLQELVGESGMSDHVHFAGRRSDVPRLLRMADLFVFPSRTEGLPNSLLEAMAAGLPIVATNVPGNCDVLTDGKTGLLVPPCQPYQLAAAMLKLLQNRSLAEELGAAASRAVSLRFQLRQTHRAYEELYVRTSGKHPV
ncbi:MAG: glycosyltransferase [Phycisphaerae bacterium]|nr:glycosyltransferase [Phycisphaerae bacterium]